MAKQLAIMTKPSFGMRDMSSAGFWFSVKFGDSLSSGALIILSTEEMAKQVEEAEVYNIDNLEGQPCQIETEGNSVHFIKILQGK